MIAPAVDEVAGLPVLAARLRRRLPWARILLRPLFVRRGDVERVANLRYGDAGKRNLLDVYRHRSRPPGGWSVTASRS
ncbi:MAG TPA: hypothetical protein VLA80_08100 [Actinomycetota bacterium]|nr:hypothetical protein [Actinomycetota bacterium]